MSDREDSRRRDAELVQVVADAAWLYEWAANFIPAALSRGLNPEVRVRFEGYCAQRDALPDVLADAAASPADDVSRRCCAAERMRCAVVAEQRDSYAAALADTTARLDRFLTAMCANALFKVAEVNFQTLERARDAITEADNEYHAMIERRCIADDRRCTTADDESIKTDKENHDG